MEVGSITESVTVTGQAPLIDTSNASTGTTLDSAALQTLPSPGRNAFMIGASVPTSCPSATASSRSPVPIPGAALLLCPAAGDDCQKHTQRESIKHTPVRMALNGKTRRR